MVACPQAQFANLESMLKHIGKVFFIGERPGMGQTMKLVNNLLSATALAATSEAIVYGTKAGLDPTIMIDVLNSGSGRSSATQDKFPRAILSRTFDLGFATHLMCKDLELCYEEAKDAGVPMQVGDAVRRLWLQVQEEIGPDEDFTTIVKMIERKAGVEIKGS